jgi:uncharacterized membrane protein
MWSDRFFAAFWLLCLLGVAWLTPPLMAPDEPTHLMRAAELARGELVGRPFEGGAGGTLDLAIGKFVQIFHDYQQMGAPPVPAGAYAAAREIQWSRERWRADFRNTAQYGPLPYLPQALGLRLGFLFDLSLLDSYYVARAFAMATALVLGAWTLRLSGWTRPLGRIVLLLPMSLFLTASTSQDGILIALGLLVAAIIGRAVERDQPPEPRLYAVAALAVATLAMGRLPYATLALLFLLRPMRGRGAVAALLFVAAATAWWLWMTADLRAVPSFPLDGKDIDAHRQLSALLANPLRGWDLAIDTLGDDNFSTFYWHSTIGKLGWLTLPLAPWAYIWGSGALGGGWLAGCFGARHLRPLDMLAAWLAVGLAVGGIFLGLYLTWSEVGAGRIEGVQGRYFLPLLMALPLLLPAWPLPMARKVLGAAALLAALPPLYAMARILAAAYR